MDPLNLIPRLYRQEYSKMVSLLCHRFGIDQIDAAEDIVSDTFLSAAETWGINGIPDNPVAWLYRVARNTALNELKHEKIFQQRIQGRLVHHHTEIVNENDNEAEIELSPQNAVDSQLRMLFAICHPAIPVEAQVSLALRILCAFSIDEIARALLTNKTNVNKRLYRAKEKLRSENIQIANLDRTELDARLDSVLLTLYLLFNEGYYSASSDNVLRKDLCLEAMRLVYLLAEHLELLGAPYVRPDVYSLLALMCFQASRFDARINSLGELVLYEQQDSSLWDNELINRGNSFFIRGCETDTVSRYHLEAAIAWWHTCQENNQEKWENILMLYNRLLMVQYSPVAALNRAYAFSRVYGKKEAIAEAESLDLSGSQLYHSLLGELYSGVDDKKAIFHLKQSLALTKAPAEREVISRKLSILR